jgi:hypothetical protein
MERRVAPWVFLFCVLAAGAFASTRTVTGRVVYGTINDDLGEDVPPGGFLSAGLPVARVRVEFNDGASFPVGVADESDANGRFSITFHGTPRITLVTKARNDYVTVKEHKGMGQNLLTDDAVKTKRDISGMIDYATCQDGDTCEIGDITVASDTTDFFMSIDRTLKNYPSRAFYITTAAHTSGTHVEDLHGRSLPGEKVVVRMGVGHVSPAWYYQIDNTIYLTNHHTFAFWHEYGHFVQDKIGAFALVPPYLGGVHAQCEEMTDGGQGNTSPNLCWGYLEGLAEWFAAVDGTEHYGSYEAMNTALADRYSYESQQCDAEDVASWTEPRAVAGVVANVLWDLIDDTPDETNDSGVDEVALATPEEVLDVMTADTGNHTSCSGLEFNSHPMGLDEFWDEWRVRHPGVVPDLYAAYAFNGVAIGNAVDEGRPAPVTLASTSHVVGQWSNDNTVTLVVSDGFDDVSGSYEYFVGVDQFTRTVADITKPPAFKSKLPVNQHDVEMRDGAPLYIHVDTFDMAGNRGTANAHFGPVYVDTVLPYMTENLKLIPFRIDPAVPSSDPTLMLGYPADITWGSHDDLSGVASVRIFFSDTESDYTKEVHTTSAETGRFTWMVTDVPATPTGQLNIIVTDKAGNAIIRWVPAPVTTPFAGPIGASLGADSDPCIDARVASGDLHNDGFDDVVLVCRWNLSGHLYVFSGSGNGLALAQDFAWRPADDLTLADLDRDGDLDVVTASLDAPGAATEAEILYNDGTGTLVDPGLALALGVLERKTVRVIRPFDGQRPVIVVFGVRPGSVPDLRAFNVAAAYAPIALPGVDPVDGDWEAADMNGDGYGDLVALGLDGAVTPALSVFAGTSAGWGRQDVEVYGSVTRADVDLGDFDASGRPDVLVTFEDVGLARVTKLLANGAAGYSTFAQASVPEREIAGGDGFIVDTANDAKAEPVAMGSTDMGAISGWYLRNDTLVGLLEDSAVVSMMPLDRTDSAWGDFDADGDLDVFQVGHDALGFHIGHYRNQLGNYIDQNDAPRPPTNLSATYDAVRGGYTFSWTAPTGASDETPVGGFGYELRVGTTSSGGQILSWIHPAGPSQQGSVRSRFLALPPGSYFYSVRTVDSGWLRSAPAAIRKTTP